MQRWQLEVTFEEARAHLGVETQRQWSDLAIARTTPLLPGLFSWVTLLAHQLLQHHHLSVRQAVWCSKLHPTFSDAIGWVRHALRMLPALFSMPCYGTERAKIPRLLFNHLLDTLCYAA